MLQLHFTASYQRRVNLTKSPAALWHYIDAEKLLQNHQSETEFQNILPILASERTHRIVLSYPYISETSQADQQTVCELSPGSSFTSDIRTSQNNELETLGQLIRQNQMGYSHASPEHKMHAAGTLLCLVSKYRSLHSH